MMLVCGRIVTLVLALFTCRTDGFAISSSRSSLGLDAKRSLSLQMHTPDTSPTTQTLVEFLQSQGSEGINDGTEIGFDSSTGLRGMYATRRFKQGEIMCRIPSDCALALSDPMLGGMDVPTFAHSGRNFIIMYLENAYAKNLWKPYLDTLPTFESQFTPTPDFYSDDEINQLEFPRAMDRAWQRIDEVFNLAEEEQMSTEELQFATWLVSSRSFSVTLTAGGDSPAGAVPTLQKKIRVLLPYLDMINNLSDESNAELHLIDPEKDEAWFAIRATRPIAQNQEITMCYGSGVDSSVEIMENYGFIPAENKIDARMLKKGGEDCIEDPYGWSTSLDEDLAALETAQGNMRNILEFRIKLKRAYADI